VSRVVVVVVGNRLRGDDAAGPLVADALRAAPGRVRVIEAGTDPLRLLDAWEGDEAVFVVDAVCSGATPGTIHTFAADDAGLLPEPLGGSTHGFGLATVVELGRTLGRLPRQLTIIGIEGTRFDMGAPAHPDVQRAAIAVAARIQASVHAPASPSLGRVVPVSGDGRS